MELSDLRGRVVETATQEVHVAADGADTGLVAVRLELEGGSGIRLAGAADGQSLRLDDEAMRSYDMAEYGSSEVRDFDKLAEREPISDVVPLVDDDGVTFGVLLATRSTRVFVFNWGDELHAEPDLPEVVRSEIGAALPL